MVYYRQAFTPRSEKVNPIRCQVPASLGVKRPGDRLQNIELDLLHPILGVPEFKSLVESPKLPTVKLLTSTFSEREVRWLAGPALWDGFGSGRSKYTFHVSFACDETVVIIYNRCSAFQDGGVANK